MAACKNCGATIEWGTMEGKWVPLIPIGEEPDGKRTHTDANGVLRALHRSICLGHTGAVAITPLAKPVVIEQAPQQLELVSRTLHYHRVDAIKQSCPTCGAAPGNTCVSPKGRERHALHRDRYIID